MICLQKAIKSKKVQPTIYVSNVDDIRLKVFPFEEMLYLNGEKKFLIIPARSPKDKHF